MYVSEDGSAGDGPWLPWEADVWESDGIVIRVDTRLSVVATKSSRSASLSDVHITSGWELATQEHRHDRVITSRFGLVASRENAVRILSACRAAISHAIQREGSIENIVVSSIVEEVVSDCNVPIVRLPR
jgi:hypothetical protein